MGGLLTINLEEYCQATFTSGKVCQRTVYRFRGNPPMTQPSLDQHSIFTSSLRDGWAIGGSPDYGRISSLEPLSYCSQATLTLWSTTDHQSNSS
ncbi:hypothetical protein L596_010574 [Steinernema carpocapsae]|uniref:Uncharacterized protein n=1 Tax=Steinernema carpocapsae TaxID=34508 RepID=A0A4U5PJ89_STECR|nr:hypothetical protein L596_010574 [Steinernema carpocapsae]